MVFFLGQTGKIEIEAAKAFEAAFGSLGLWGWGALVIVAGILLGLLIGFLIRGSLGEGIETKGKIEKLPKTCQEAVELKEKLQKEKGVAEEALKKLSQQRDAALAIMISTSIAATAAIAAAIIFVSIPLVGTLLAIAAALATAAATAAAVVLAELDQLISKVREYKKFLDSLIDLAVQIGSDLCP